MGECLLVIAAIAAATLLGKYAAIAVGLALFAAGLPHGFIRGAQANPRLASPLYWAGYIAAAALVFAGFLLAPVGFLITFLAFSLVHFAISDALPSRAANLSIGALAIGGSALFQRLETGAMLGLAVGGKIPLAMMDALEICGAIGVIIALALACKEPRRQWTLLPAIAIVWLLQPVLAVGAIFYLYHAAPIQRRSSLSEKPVRHLGILMLAIGLGIVGWLASLYFGLPGRSEIALLAAGSIAIVFPHLLEDGFDRIAAKSAGP